MNEVYFKNHCIHNTVPSFIINIASFFGKIQNSIGQKSFTESIRCQSRFDVQNPIFHKTTRTLEYTYIINQLLYYIVILLI